MNSVPTQAELSHTIEQATDIDASPEVVFESILAELADMHEPTGKTLNLKLERWPGGRWFRDLGSDGGHLWGFVQVIKPPKLLEITGPLMMSFPAINHVTYRVAPRGSASTLQFKHRCFGEIDLKMLTDMKGGWGMFMDAIKTRAMGKKG